MSLHASLLFHLNLEYSSVEVVDRGPLVRRCYRPLLDLVAELPWLTLAVEAPAATLETLAELDPEWIQTFRARLEEGRVELVGSGDTQLIGPLVPASVNRWNQELGRRRYEELCGVAPRTALVGEMAWSQGLVDAYLDAGYGRLLMEWNNPRRSHPEWEEEWRYGEVETASPSGRPIALAFTDTLAFQKMQRVVTGDLSTDEYLAWLERHRPASDGERRHLFLYANDAEVFGFRPGRYRSEPPLAAGCEWERMASVLCAVHEQGVEFTSPERFFGAGGSRPRIALSSVCDPVPVKKQPKYNVTRWALSGRDDVGLNARCFARAAELEESGSEDAEDWRALCRAWSSDRRTHLTERRWGSLERTADGPVATCRTDAPFASAPLSEGEPLARAELSCSELSRAELSWEGRFVVARTDGVELRLDARRGLAIDALAFPAVAGEPLVGTLRHGELEEIDWAADFYSGHAVLEIPAKSRVTDLEAVEPELVVGRDRLEVGAVIETSLGTLEKRVRVFAERVEVSFGLAALGERPLGNLRAGIVTLATRSGGWGEDLVLGCASGGALELFPLERECDHGAAVSALVSARAAFGATDGRFLVRDRAKELELSWDPARLPALPLLTHRRIGEARFVRIAPSLGEIDETLRPGSPLRDFTLVLRARRLP